MLVISSFNELLCQVLEKCVSISFAKRCNRPLRREMAHKELAQKTLASFMKDCEAWYGFLLKFQAF